MRYKSEETMKEITAAIDSYFFIHKETPSITEIAKLVGRSRSTIHAYLQEMNRIGQIHYDGVTLETPVTSKADSGYSLSPIIGSIACGEPQYEEENFEAYVALPDALFGPGEHFILRAKGESMIEQELIRGSRCRSQAKYCR
jgi:repressor LexA